MAVSLRSGGKPARLLLDLWAAQANGQRFVMVDLSPARTRLLALGYVQELPAWCYLKLTPAGQQAARALEAERAG